MAFDVAPEAYDRFMGRYSSPLATELLAAAGVTKGDRVLDVGCGPGVLTRRLVDLLGSDHVTGVDPSPPFVAAARQRLPGVEIVEGGAEHLPFGDDAFDHALAQLVVPFMADPVAGLAEMRRVTRPGGTVAVTAWNHAADGHGPLSQFWGAVETVTPGAYDEWGLVGQREGELAGLVRDAGLTDVREQVLTITVTHETFEEWWEPYTGGVGPAGDHVARLDDDGRARLREAAHEMLGGGPIRITGAAWCALGRA